jgi:septal ring factor EnvC (AmiA/AmiB activator)
VKKKWYVFCKDVCICCLDSDCVVAFFNNLQLTNTLQRKLDEVRREKAMLEQQIESEKQSHKIMESELNELRNTSTSNKSKLSQLRTTTEAEEEMEEED